MKGHTMFIVETAGTTFRYSQRHDALAKVRYLNRVGVPFTRKGF